MPDVFNEPHALSALFSSGFPARWRLSRAYLPVDERFGLHPIN